jgi:outer membrane protein TolC
MHRKNIFKNILYCLAILSITCTSAAAQQRADSGKVFSLKDLETLVLQHHPIVKQATLLSGGARARVMQALGKFDPKIESEFARKEFGNTDYYNNWGNQLKVPLWLAGADLKIGYDKYTGTYTHPMYRTGDDGLSGVGLSIPIGQGLIIDERRNTLRQARIMTRYAEADRVKQIISVWYNAVKEYWNWYSVYNQYQLVKEGVTLAQQRFEAVSRQTQIGDKPPIDSVEASITVQDREIQLAKLSMEIQNARLILSNYIWGDNETPLELPENAVPPRIAIDSLLPEQAPIDTLVKYAANQHPELIKLRSKGDQLLVEESFRREMLKPKLNVTGTLITSRNTMGDYYPKYYDIGWSNYKFGVDFAFPLFLRSERGKLKEVRLKQQENTYDLQQTGREINNNIYASFNSLKAYKNQLNIQTISINNQQRLLTAELQKFELGESTLFVINSRESKLIDMKIKQAEMVAGYQKTMAELYYKAGTRQSAP